MKTKLILTVLLTVFVNLLFSQTKKVDESIADCAGAINIFKSGNYSFQFTGNGGSTKEFINYPSLAEFSDDNVVWVSFIAEEDGVLTFEAVSNQDYLQMVVFEEMTNNICNEIGKGIAEIKRVHKGIGQKRVGLNQAIEPGILYPLELTAGQKIVIAFSTVEKSKSLVKLNFQFTGSNPGLRAANETKIIDTRNDEFAPTLSISVRDAETDEPIVANLTIEGSKEINALYKGSDFFFNTTRTGKVVIKCDAEGYFFVDRVENLVGTANQEIVILMDPISKGKSMQIEEIEFKPGTSEFMPGSEAKLRRLRDFLALNADINIEIQGHVYSDGDNSVASQKMSEARAKRVMIYLIENGISKDRLVAVGYGNTKPIFPEPKFAYEEQANRRVEILVK